MRTMNRSKAPSSPWFLLIISLQAFNTHYAKVRNKDVLAF